MAGGYSSGFSSGFDSSPYVNLVKFALTDMADPGVNFDHVLRVRARKTDADAIGRMRVRLMEGTTEIASFEEDL